LVEHALQLGADLRRAGRDYAFDQATPDWHWSTDAIELVLPLPRLAAPCQTGNAAAAIAALHALRDRLGWNPAAIAQGVRAANAGARLQRFAGTPELVVDVAHNPQAARVLAAWLQQAPIEGRTLAVFGALDDKDIDGIVCALTPCVDAWYLVGLERDSPRGLPVHLLRERIGARIAPDAIVSVEEDVTQALALAFAGAMPGDRVIAFGSFMVAAPALAFATRRS
jgi:dihydrofolate synthase/folylpolyglutamate synthase